MKISYEYERVVHRTLTDDNGNALPDHIQVAMEDLMNVFQKSQPFGQSHKVGEPAALRMALTALEYFSADHINRRVLMENRDELLKSDEHLKHVDS